MATQDDAIKFVNEWSEWLKKTKYKIGAFRRIRDWVGYNSYPDCIRLRDESGNFLTGREGGYNNICFSDRSWSITELLSPTSDRVYQFTKRTTGFTTHCTLRLEVGRCVSVFDCPDNTQDRTEIKIHEESKKIPDEWLTLKQRLESKQATTRNVNRDLMVEKSAKYLVSRGVCFDSREDLVGFVSRIKTFVKWDGYGNRWPESLEFILKATEEEIGDILAQFNVGTVNKE